MFKGSSHVWSSTIEESTQCRRLSEAAVQNSLPVDVGAAGPGDARPQLGVAEPGHGGGDAGDQEGEHDGGAGVLLRHGAGQHVDAHAFNEEGAQLLHVIMNHDIIS